MAKHRRRGQHSLFPLARTVYRPKPPRQKPPGLSGYLPMHAASTNAHGSGRGRRWF